MLRAQHAAQSQTGSCEHFLPCMLLQCSSKPAHLPVANVLDLTAIPHKVLAKAGPQDSSQRKIHASAAPNVTGAADVASASDIHLTCIQIFDWAEARSKELEQGAYRKARACLVRLCIVRSCSLVKCCMAATWISSSRRRLIGSAWHAPFKKAHYMIR